MLSTLRRPFTLFEDRSPMPVDLYTTHAVRAALCAWFATARRALPWRATRDPYAIWVSEVMLQQTQVKTVVPYYQRFLTRLPTVAHLARADEQEVLKLWEGLGYYSRARHLQRAARIVHAQLGGRIPDQWESFRGLPGVGDYIAAAVLSIAFDRPFAVVDGNVKRVLARLFQIAEPVNHGPSHKTFQALADQLLDPVRPRDFNQALMELGALVCTPRRPLCAQCPLSSHCGAFQAAAVALYPHRAPRPQVPEHYLAAALVRKNNRVLIVRRPLEGLLGGLWEFPAVRYTAPQEAAAACVAHLREALNLTVTVERQAATIRHAYTHFKIRMALFDCLWRKGVVPRHAAVVHQWIDPAHIDRLALHRAAQKALPYLSAAPAGAHPDP
jgi:A/G-specific adenine glycosylase